MIRSCTVRLSRIGTSVEFTPFMAPIADSARPPPSSAPIPKRAPTPATRSLPSGCRSSPGPLPLPVELAGLDWLRLATENGLFQESMRLCLQHACWKQSVSKVGTRACDISLHSCYWTATLGSVRLLPPGGKNVNCNVALTLLTGV